MLNRSLRDDAGKVGKNNVNTPLTRALRKHPELVFCSFGLNAGLSACLLAVGARLKIVIFGVIFSGAALGFVYLCLKHGFVLSKGERQSMEGNPRAFWQSMIACYVLYLVGTFFPIALHLQDLSRANRI